MRYCQLGALSSKAEEGAIVNAIRANKLSRSVVGRVGEYFVHLRALDREGLSKVRGSWIPTSHPNLVLFTGRRRGEEPTMAGGQRVFAAIELDAQDRVETLIKLSCDYLGAANQWTDNCADAEDRFLRGTRAP